MIIIWVIEHPCLFQGYTGVNTNVHRGTYRGKKSGDYRGYLQQNLQRYLQIFLSEEIFRGETGDVTQNFYKGVCSINTTP
jgi:hypothetical protein